MLAIDHRYSRDFKNIPVILQLSWFSLCTNCMVNKRWHATGGSLPNREITVPRRWPPASVSVQVAVSVFTNDTLYIYIHPSYLYITIWILTQNTCHNSHCHQHAWYAEAWCIAFTARWGGNSKEGPGTTGDNKFVASHPAKLRASSLGNLI